jgi:CHAD domain-containing protein
MAENSGLAATLPGLVVAARAICQRHRAEARLWVASRRYDDLIRQLRLLVAEAGKSEALATPIGEVAGRLLEKRQRKLLSRARGLMRLSAEKRHRVRIAGKKLRYASEFFVSLFHGEPALVYIKGLEGVQEILGSLNDNAVTASLLKELGLAVRRDPALYPAVTEMRRGLPELRRDLLKRLGSTWKAFSCHKPFWKV